MGFLQVGIGFNLPDPRVLNGHNSAPWVLFSRVDKGQNLFLALLDLWWFESGYTHTTSVPQELTIKREESKQVSAPTSSFSEVHKEYPTYIDWFSTRNLSLGPILMQTCLYNYRKFGTMHEITPSMLLSAMIKTLCQTRGLILNIMQDS